MYTLQKDWQIRNALIVPHGFAEPGELDGHTIEELRLAHYATTNITTEFHNPRLRRWFVRAYLGLPVAKEARYALALFLDDPVLVTLSDEQVVGSRQFVVDHIDRHHEDISHCAFLRLLLGHFGHSVESARDLAFVA